MSKKHKIIIVITAFAIISLVLVYFLLLVPGKKSITSAINAVPMDASVVLEHKNAKNILAPFKESATIWSELSKLNSLHSINRKITYLDSLLKSQKELEEILDNNKVIISLHQKGKERLEFLYAINFSNSGNTGKLKHLIDKFTSNGAEISERIYNDIKIYDVKLPNRNKEEEFSYSFAKGNLLISYSAILLEESIRQLFSGISLNQKKGFKKVFSTAGKNVDLNMYINYQSFAKAMVRFLNYKNKDISFRITNFANWTEADIVFRDKSISFNGFTYTDPKSNNYLNLILQQEPVKLEVEKIIPSNTTNFVALGIHDFDQFKKDYKSYLTHSGKIHRYEYHINKIREQFDIDLEEIFYSILDREVAIVFTDINAFDIKKNAYAVFHVNDTKEAEKKMIQIIQKFADKNSIDPSTLMSFFEINNNDYAVYQMPVIKVPQKLFGDIYSLTEPNYFIFIDDYMVFGSSVQTLRQYIEDIIANQTLSDKQSYKEFSNSLSSRSNFYFFSYFPESKSLYENYLSKEVTNYIENNYGILSKFEFMGLQFNSSKDLIYNNLHISFNPEEKIISKYVWETELIADNFLKPSMVINHYTNEKEIFTQDSDNNIYLIDKKGKILWARKLDERIISDIYQIDYYKNNKLQLLFNTKSNVYLIDRNGKDVADYPVKLKSQATNGIAVFDYDNDQDYRIFIACKNREVFPFDKTGKKVKGWKFAKASDIVTTEVQFVRLRNKDYIIFSDLNRSYILNRRGQERVKIKDNFAKSKNNTFSLRVETLPEKTHLATTDSTGKVHLIYFDGSVKTKEIHQFTPEHFFEYDDLNGDGLFEYIYVDQKKLEVYNEDKSTMYINEFPEVLRDPPIIFTFSATEKKIGIVSQNNNEIYLFNSDGSMFSGFPYTGGSQFSIAYFNNNFNLFVGSGQNSIYSYKIE